MKIPMLRLLTLFIPLLSSNAFSQVVTAPISPDQRLINPAAAATRPFRGVAVKLNREASSSKALNLYQSSYEVATQVDTGSVNLALSKNAYFFEANFLPQQGKRTTNGTSVTSFQEMTDENSMTNERTLALYPMQGVAGVRLGNYGSVGLKSLYSYADFNTDDEFGYRSSSQYASSTKTEGTRKSGFLLTSAGAVVNFFNTGFFGGIAAEYLRISDEVNSTTKETNYSSGSANESVRKDIYTQATTVRKDILGLGYMKKFSGGNLFRADLSRELMPSLAAGYIPDGELWRLVTEITYSYFHFGTEVTSQKGFYIDPYNLIPYYFNPEGFSAEPTISYGFFGGLKTSKGHSFGISYMQSSETSEEKLSSTSQEKVKLEKSSMTYGVSYMYLF